MAKFELVTVSTNENDAVLAVDEEGFHKLSNGEQALITDTPHFYNIVQPGSVKKNPALKKFKGKFMNAELGLDFEQKRFVYIGNFAEGRNHFPPFVEGDNSEPLCKSYDGIVPAFNAEQPGAALCSECPFGDLMWKDGNKPECAKYLELLLLDVDIKYPMVLPMKGTSLGAWNLFKKSITQKIRLSNEFNKLVKLGLKKVDNPPEGYVDVTTCVIQVTMSDEGTYYVPSFELVEAPELDQQALLPLINHYGYKFITEAAIAREAKKLEYEQNSTIGNQALFESAPEAQVELGDDAAESDEEFDV